MNPAQVPPLTSRSPTNAGSEPAGFDASTGKARSTTAGRIKLILLFLLFASPVIASYLTYYVFPPSGRTNYGELIEPQRPVGQSQFVRSGGESPLQWAQLRGKWVLLVAYARSR